MISISNNRDGLPRSVPRRNELQLTLVFLFLGVVEFFAVHLALSATPAFIRICHAVLSLSFLIFLVCGLFSLKFNPIRISDNELRIPIGMFGHQIVDYASIKSIGRVEKQGVNRDMVTAFAVLSEPNFFIETDNAKPHGLFKRKKQASGFAMAVDDPEGMRRYLRERIPEL